MNARHFHTLPLILALSMLGACSFFSDKDSDKEESKSSSSSAEVSSSSSSGNPGRLEVDYADTLKLDDSVSYQVVDSLVEESPWNFYLGEFPRGTIIHLGIQNDNLDKGAKFRVVSEKGTIQLPTNALPDGNYADYAEASDTSYLTNHFVVMDTGYYYLEVEASRKSDTSSRPDFSAFLTVDSAYYQFVGLEDSLELPANTPYQGCFRINTIEDSVKFMFAGTAGQNLSIITSGQSLAGVSLREVGGALLDSAVADLREYMLPQDSTEWSLKIRSTLPSYFAGNYAFFTLNLTSIQLGRGEYLAMPDTMPRPGDTLGIDREGSESSGWDVRHDHYVYLGSLTAGDTIILWHGTDGIERVSKLLRILDSKGVPVDTLSIHLTTNWVKQQGNIFVPAKTGTYFLHYMGLGGDDTYWKDEHYTLHLRAMVQKPHSLQTFQYDPPNYGFTVSFKTGDTLSLDDLLDFVSITPSTASRNYLPLVSRTERSVLRDSVDLKFGGSASGDEVRSRWLVAGEAGTAHLLIQSTADPSKVDTCTIKVVEP